jgi:hypothetical protein
VSERAQGDVPVGVTAFAACGQMAAPVQPRHRHQDLHGDLTGADGFGLQRHDVDDGLIGKDRRRLTALEISDDAILNCGE